MKIQRIDTQSQKSDESCMCVRRQSADHGEAVSSLPLNTGSYVPVPVLRCCTQAQACKPCKSGILGARSRMRSCAADLAAISSQVTSATK